jgi:hypothetical protein
MNKFFVKLAVVIVTAGLVLALAGCDTNVNNGTNTLQGTSGSFTLTGLDGYTGKYAVAYGKLPDTTTLLLGIGGLKDAKPVGVRIARGKQLTLPLYTITVNEYDEYDWMELRAYSGSDTVTDSFGLGLPGFMVIITDTEGGFFEEDSEEIRQILFFDSVTFSNGKATKSADEAWAAVSGGL